MNRLARGGSFAYLAAAFVVLALALRLGAVAAVDFHAVNDPEDYIRMGESLADHGRFPDSAYATGPTATRAPLYPLTLAGVFAVTGDSVTAARVFGALLGTLVAILTGLIAAHLWSRRAGVIALGLAAMAPPLVLISVTLMTETLFTALALAAILLMLRARAGPTRRTVVTIGVLIGLATLARPNGAVLIPVALLALWQAPRRSLRALVNPAIVLAAAAVVIAPWTIRNERELHAFVPVTTSGWITAAGMFNETTRTDPRYPAAWRIPTADPEMARVYAAHRSGSETEVVAAFREEAKHFLSEHPAFPLEAIGRNLLRFAHLTDFELGKAGWRSVGLEAWPGNAANVAFLLLLLLAVGGIVAGGLRAGPWWLWLAPVLLIVTVALVGTGVRYRTPVDPFVILLAAFLMHRLLPGGAAEQRAARRDRSMPPGPEAGRAANLRVTTARGTLINGAFQVGLSALGLLRRLSVAAFLTTEQYGIWGILMAVLVTLAWLKQVGISDKYIQQRDADQERAFQQAFTLEVGLSTIYFALACAALPIYAIAYDRQEIIAPGLLLSTAVMINALQTPSWIAYRRLQYARQRMLTSVDPVVSIIATVALAAAGAGVWGLVVGGLIGTICGAAVCVAWCPYPLRLRRVDRATLKSYVTFSWPLLALALSNLLLVQGVLLVANHAVGLAAVGIIGLVSGIATFANRADAIVSQTIYPAVCQVAHEPERLREVFLKSNRIALMWGMPFAAGLALFARDFVRLALGPEWASSVDTLIIVALTCGFGQLAFNWSVFMRASGRTQPMLFVSLANVAVYLGIAIPAMFAFGVIGYAYGFAVGTAMQILMRARYIRQLLGEFSVLRQLVRSVAPVLPGTAFVLLGRLTSDGPSTLAHVISEVVLFAVITIASTVRFERRLVDEVVSYVTDRVSTPRARATTATASEA